MTTLYPGSLGLNTHVGVGGNDSMVVHPPFHTNPVQKPMNVDEAIAAKVMYKRAVEESRKPRIFDPKSRTIGIDKNALDLQVAEKREREKLERDRNSRFDSETLFFNSIRKRQEVEAQRQRRDLEKTTKDYGLTHLRKESRREWDLSDKEALRKKGFHTLDEENLGAASLMGLAGEDLSTQDRKAEQQRQMREWINQQKFEKQMLKKQEKEENDLWASQQEALCARLTAIKDEEARQRRMRAEQTADANRQMSLEKYHTAIEDRLKDQAANDREIDYHLHDPHLADGRLDLAGYEQAGGETAGDQMTLGAPRDSFKGASRKDKQACLDYNMILWKEKQDRRRSEMDADMLWSHQQEMQRKQLVAVERETYRQRQRGEEATVQTNFSLSADQKGAQNILKTKVYTNDPSDDYFNYFGTTTR